MFSPIFWSLTLHQQHLIKTKKFFIVSSIPIPLKMKHKQQSIKSRMLLFKHFTNTFTHIYSHDNIITLDYIKNTDIKATLEYIKNTEIKTHSNILSILK